MMTMQQYFYRLADFLQSRCSGEEIFLATLDGEDSDFVRFNRSAVRQPGHVSQAYFSLDLVQGSRHVEGEITLCNDFELDSQRLESLLKDLREKIAAVPEDPYLLYSTQVQNSEQIGENRLPDRKAVIESILNAGVGRDLVGIFAQGEIYAGFANSLGQRNWFSSSSFNFDWCFYHDRDKAVKNRYAGFEWNEREFERKVEFAGEQLAVISKPARTISPGEYRAYFTPAAMEEFIAMVAYGGFGVKAHRTKSTPLLQMLEDGKTLSPKVTFCENTIGGIDANFQSAGYLKPDRISLMEQGKLADTLVSDRSAREYGLTPNGASEEESPDSLDMAAGDISSAQILPRLGTGLYVNDLWYLNYSDRPAGRITGMTRFATFWVEDGKIVCPVNVMRFDETVYRVLGENLEGLTADRDFIPSSSTYEGRSTSSVRLPGMLVNQFRFTL
jgi:predicted Zn-dependent protease